MQVRISLFERLKSFGILFNVLEECFGMLSDALISVGKVAYHYQIIFYAIPDPHMTNFIYWRIRIVMHIQN